MTNLFKKGIFFLLAMSLTIACSDDDDNDGGDATTITNVDFTVTSKNDSGNEVGVTPTSTGGTSYSVDFNDPSVSDNSDVIETVGVEAVYTYPAETGTYDITVTASATNAESVSTTKSHTVTFEAATVLADFEDAASLNLRDDASGNVTISVESQTGLDGGSSMVGVAVEKGLDNWNAFSINPGNYINPNNKGIITVEYYQSEGVARDILFKLHGTKTTQDGIFDIEVLTTSTADTGWQTLTFDFKGADVVGSYPNGELPVVLDQYTSMSLFVDFGTAVAGTYWFDNIEGAEWGAAIADTDSDDIIDSVDKCPNEAGLLEDDGCPPSGTGADPHDDFEGSGNITWYADSCGMNEAFANPSSSGINTSSTVLEYDDTGGTYANIGFDLNAAKTDKFDLTTKNIFTVKVYVPTPTPGVTEDQKITLKLQDGSSSAPWEGQVEVAQNYVYDTWQELTFDFSSVSSETKYSRVVVQFNGENNAEAVKAYIDDFSYGAQ